MWDTSLKSATANVQEALVITKHHARDLRMVNLGSPSPEL